MSEFNQDLWAPWRIDYIRSFENKSMENDQQCFLCDYAAQPEQDAEHYVVRRTSQTLLVLNLFPYTNGHLLIAPLRHVAELNDLTPDELSEMGQFTRDSIEMLKPAVSAQGYNVGMNFGRCAGAGLPDHLHAHVVPRWNGDTNFMSTVSDVRVIPDSLEQVYRRLRAAADDLGLA